MSERLNIYFNKIFILQSLRYERRTGDEIFTKVRQISFRDGSITGVLIDIRDKEHFFQVLSGIRHESIRGIKPFIHFEIHGSVEGFELDTGERIAWELLKEPLREINKTTGNNLFISLATCFGAYLLKIYKPWETCPFVGYISPLREVKNHELEASYSVFFEVLLLEKDFDKAIKALQDTVPRNPKDYVFLNCVGYFDRLISIYKGEKDDPKKRTARAKAIERKFRLKNPGTRLSSKEIKRHADRLLLTEEENEIQRMRAVFLHERV